MKTGRLRRDDEGQWYVIPESELKAFAAVVGRLPHVYRTEAPDMLAAFKARYDQYRIADPFDVPVVMSQSLTARPPETRCSDVPLCSNN